MYRVYEMTLPGRSGGLVGASHGDVAVSAYFVHMEPGEGPGPHCYPATR